MRLSGDSSKARRGYTIHLSSTWRQFRAAWCECWVLNSGPLHEQCVFFIPESSKLGSKSCGFEDEMLLKDCLWHRKWKGEGRQHETSRTLFRFQFHTCLSLAYPVKLAIWRGKLILQLTEVLRDTVHLLKTVLYLVFKIVRLFPGLSTGDAITRGELASRQQWGRQDSKTVFPSRHTTLVLRIRDRVGRKIAYTRKCSIFKTQQAFN